jgi:hypothetical protein
MRADFVGFESGYAETSNREVLLNLARLQNHDPTYFFKIGEISSLYRMQASVTGNASYALQSTNPHIGGPTGGGTPLLNYENDPSFTFIPVNDQTNAQFLLQPVAPETFYALYQEGWRVDQLFRLMVDRIELTTVKGPGVCDVETFRNLPPQVYTKPDGTQEPDYVRDADTLSRYVTFLRISAVLYALQKRGDLILSGTNNFVPYDNNSALTEDSAPPKDRGISNGGTDTKSKTPTASDIVNAMSKSAVWENKKDVGWLLGQRVPNAVFYLNHYIGGGTAASPNTDLSDIEKIEQDILADPDMSALKLNQAVMLRRVLGILANGFSITGTAASQSSNIGPCPPDTSKVSSHLVLRSLLGIMAAAAQEQAPFEALLNSKDLKVPPNAILEQDKQGNLPPEPLFKDAVPPIELIPLMRITSASESKETPPLVRLTYRGKTYQIADMKIPGPEDAPENQYWNRDVFRLVDQLTSQVTVDISKFPLPAILQLNTQ